jgi:hypothetical protein
MLGVTDASKKGDALEDCVTELFLAYPNLFKDEGKRLAAGEKDRVITLIGPSNTLVSTWGADRLYVDCKNEKDRYTSAYASTFVTRIREVRGTLGLVVATAGITTQQDANAARVLYEAAVRDGVLIAHVDAADLQRVCDGTPWWEVVHDQLTTAREGVSR